MHWFKSNFLHLKTKVEMTTVELCQKGLGFRVMAPSGDKQPLDVAVSTNIVKILFNPRVGISSSREPIILECV